MDVSEAFSQNKDAVAMLTSLVHHHAFIEKVINQAKERTLKLIAQIDELIIQLE